MSPDTTPARPTMPALRDSGQFRPYQIIPEPVYYKIGPTPAKPPFKVRFSVRESPRPEPKEFGITQVEHQMGEKGKRLVKKNFERALWVLPNGHIVTESLFLDIKDWVCRHLFNMMNPVIELDIDFDLMENRMGAVHLPENPDNFVRPKSRFSCDPWKLCVTDKNRPDWHDLIMAFDKGFLLQSVRLAPSGTAHE
jgi:hypothetical protein